MTESITAWEETALYEAKIRYEGERRKTELVLAQIAAKTERKKARLNVLTDADALTAFGIVSVVAILVGCITYGVTRPADPPNPYEFEYKKVLVQSCADVKGHWDDWNRKCEK